MEKIKKHLLKVNTSKKFILAIILVVLCTFTFPNYSHAFITETILNKALTGIIILIVDSFNRQMAFMFKIDTLGDTVLTDIGKISDVWGNDNKQEAEKNFLDKFAEGMEKTSETIEQVQYTWFDLLLSPDDIFSGKVKIANANIFTQDPNWASEFTPFGKLLEKLKSTVATLYYIMRNLAIVILLCLLIYAGIRIVLASTIANEKAKWKEYLMDWLKALALVMFVHVIMIGIFYISDTVVDGLSQGMNYEHTIVSEIRIQYNKTSFFDVTSNWIYVIMYIYVTYLTIVFIISYFKRLVYLMVLIIISPIVSSLYAFGKTSKSIFEKWFKEFTMGVFVQPFHMLVYTILLLIPLKLMNGSGFTEGTAIQINYPSIQIYALISLAMIRPIEKYMREIFQFGNTRIDNIASFESGKQTIDKGVKVATEVTKTVALAVAAPVAAGAVAAGAGAATAGVGAAEAGAGMAEAGAGMEAAEASSGFGELRTLGQFGEVSDGINDSMVISNDPFHGDYFSGDQFMDNSLQTGDGYDGNLYSKRMSEQELQSELDNFREDGLDEDGIKQIENSLRAQGHGGNINNVQAGRIENIEPNTNHSNNSNSRSLNSNNNSRNLDNNSNSANLNNDNNDRDQLIDVVSQIRDNMTNSNDNNKPTLDGSTLATALMGRLGGQYEKMSEKFLSPGMLEQFENVRQAGHEFVDTFYIPGKADVDWKGTIEINKEYIEGKKHAVVNNFVKDPKNIKEAIKVFGLKDKVNRSTGEVTTAEQQAQEKLQQAAPYIALGVKDVGTLKDLSSRNGEPYRVARQYQKEAKAEEKYQQFIQNNNNVKRMETIVASELGKLPEFRSGDTTVVQQVQQQVNKNFTEGRPYIVSGDAKNSETLNRLVNLERKIDQKVDMVGSANQSKNDYVVMADKIIDKAVQKNVKRIKLPVNGNDKVAVEKTKALENVMNEALKERRPTQQRPEQPPTQSN